MKILITGGAGFIGGHLAQKLLDQDGIHIDLLDNFSRAVHDPFLEQLTANDNVGIVERDLLEHGSLDDLADDYTHIVHFAAIVGVSHVLKKPYDVLRRNEAMTFAALDLAHRQKDLKRFVFASTSEIVAGTLLAYGIDVPTPETTPICMPDPSDIRHTYLLSKLYGEALCHHCGMPFTAVRPHNVYGPRMGLVHVVPEIAKKVLALPQGGDLEVFSADHKRAFCYIDDATEIISRLMLGGDDCQGVFNLGTQDPEVTIREVCQTICDVLDRSDVNLVEGPTTTGSPTRRAPDMSKTTSACGYSSQVSLKEGIGKTLAWYDEHVFAGKGPSAV
ncbi:NAD(P)-dependent oxidoreductase [Phycisphaeraceae bacterium D3-23]